MAWVLQAVWFNITQVDSGGNEKKLRYEMTPQVDWAAYEAAALAALAHIEEVSAASTVKYSLDKVYSNDALALPAAGVQLEASAVLTGYDSADPLKKHTARIYAPETDVFLATTGAGANIVNTEHVHVQEFWDMFDSSGGELCLSDGEHTKSYADDGLISGIRVTRGKRGG